MNNELFNFLKENEGKVVPSFTSQSSTEIHSLTPHEGRKGKDELRRLATREGKPAPFLDFPVRMSACAAYYKASKKYDPVKIDAEGRYQWSGFERPHALIDFYFGESRFDKYTDFIQIGSIVEAMFNRGFQPEKGLKYTQIITEINAYNALKQLSTWEVADDRDWKRAPANFMAVDENGCNVIRLSDLYTAIEIYKSTYEDVPRFSNESLYIHQPELIARFGNFNHIPVVNHPDYLEIDTYEGHDLKTTASMDLFYKNIWDGLNRWIQATAAFASDDKMQSFTFHVVTTTKPYLYNAVVIERDDSLMNKFEREIIAPFDFFLAKGFLAKRPINTPKFF